jgi:hypothetical protein
MNPNIEPAPRTRAEALAAEEATQVVHPWRATLRTAVQVGIPALLVLVGVVPEVLTIVEGELGGHLPDGVRAWLLGAAAVVTAIAAALARIMALPAVDRALGHLGLKASPPVK